MIESLEIKDLFNLSEEDREKVIQESVDYLLELMKADMKEKEISFKMSLSFSMFQVQKNKEKALENENYELCYIYDEIGWAMEQKLKELFI